MAPSLSVAIVEDHDDLRNELLDLFVAEGYRVTAFASAESIRRQASRFDLYIIDIGLPGEDGMSLSHWLRQSDPRCRIFILTAHDDNQKRIDSFRTGIELFLGKPVDPQQLMRAVAMVASPNRAIGEADNGNYHLVLGTGILKGPSSAIKLSSSEVALLKKLGELRQLPLSIKEVAEALNLSPDQLNTGTLEARISILRKKFVEIGGTRNVIAAVRKYGYKINANIVFQ